MSPHPPSDLLPAGQEGFVSLLGQCFSSTLSKFAAGSYAKVCIDFGDLQAILSSLINADGCLLKGMMMKGLVGKSE